MVTIYNFRNGARGVRVAWLCEEMGVAYEPIVLPFPAPPSFRARHALGSVPFLEDEGGVAMGESVAIMLYLAGRYGPTPLLPQGPAQASVLELLVMSEATLGGTLNGLLAAKYAGPSTEQRNWSVRYGEDQITRVLGYVADRLGEKPYLMGETVTLADLALGTTVGLWRSALGGAVPVTLERWFERLKQRPAYGKAAAAFAAP